MLRAHKANHVAYCSVEDTSVPGGVHRRAAGGDVDGGLRKE